LNILSTGGAGYVGSVSADAVASAGYKPIVFDNLSTGRRELAEPHLLIVADLEDKRATRETLETFAIEAVLHFAGSAYVGESIANPRKYFQNNVANTISLLDAMLDCGVKRIIYSSSCAAYGIPAKVPITEDAPQHPVSPYGESKLMAEKVLSRYGEAHGLQWLALRYFNAAGATTRRGEPHDRQERLIPRAIQAVLTGKPVDVFGTDYPTSDGTAIRDFVHVVDLAAAHLRALEYLQAGKGSRTFNLGTGEGHSVRQVLAMIEKVTGREVPQRTADRRAGDPPVLVADPRAAREALAWTPQHSSLHEIVASAWAWHSSSHPAMKRSAHDS
jgi:UDP-glucose-4-epimerase GalE